MMFKWLIGVCLFTLLNLSFAENAKVYHQEGRERAKKPGMPYSCEIEIINDSYQDLIVSGQFLDGCPIIPFVFYSYERPYYIDLWHNRFCQNVMYLTVADSFGQQIYSGYTPARTTVYIGPYYMNHFKTELRTMH